MDQDQKQEDGQGLVRSVLGYAWVAGISAAVLPILVLISYRYEATLWNWLELLIVPAMLALGGYWVNWSLSRNAQGIAERHAQDAALQAYLDHMGQLLLDKDQPLRTSKASSEVRMLARARTLTILEQLDASRKKSVLRFLSESGLINREQPIIVLDEANLVGADLSGALLGETIVYRAFLTRADLSNAILRGASFERCKLHAANLWRANLSGAVLSIAELDGANLSDTNLKEAELRNAEMRKADLTNARLPNTCLRYAVLIGADLSEADLRGADLRGADLRDAQGLTQGQIKQAKGDQTTKLPGYLQRPEAWNNSTDG